jgi:hypothetical protein
MDQQLSEAEEQDSAAAQCVCVCEGIGQDQIRDWTTLAGSAMYRMMIDTHFSFGVCLFFFLSR